MFFCQIKKKKDNEILIIRLQKSAYKKMEKVIKNINMKCSS